MILQMFSIYDTKTNYYRPPICCKNQPDAIRLFTTLMKQNTGKDFDHFPEDFRVYCVGDFDDDKGEVHELSQPTLLCELKDLLPEKKNGKDR